MVINEWSKVILIITLVYILPVSLFFYDLVPFYWRFHALILVAATIASIGYLYRFSVVELGFTSSQLRSAAKAIAVPTLATAILMSFYHAQQGARLDNSAYSWPFYLFFVGLSVPLQEFLFRGFLFALLTRLKLATWGQVVLSALLYSFVHIIYRDLPTLIFTFLFGLAWSVYYARFRDIYSIIFSHGLLGSIAILLGLA
jgi:uncharacterized protein